jgi:hypothetical protein
MKKLIVSIYIAATVLFGYVKAETIYFDSFQTVIAKNIVKEHERNTSVIFGKVAVKMVNKKAEVTWVTDKEHNIKQFEIQRSANGEAFKTIGIFFSLQDSKEIKIYRFKDELKNVSSKKIRYRIKQVDLNNNHTFSRIINVSI